ncbi:MAG: PilN domain-containing protein [Porticoccaceae bacterium]
MLAEITKIKIKRQELSLRMKVVRSLQDGRTEIVSIFDQLVYAIPEDIYLTKLERSAATMMLYGVSESNHQLSVLMRNLNKSAQYDNASLVEMQQDNNASAFNLQVIVGAKISPKL